MCIFKKLGFKNGKTMVKLFLFFTSKYMDYNKKNMVFNNTNFERIYFYVYRMPFPGRSKT